MSGEILRIGAYSALLVAACRPAADARRAAPAGPTAAAVAAAPRAPAPGDSSAVAFVRAFYAAYAPRAVASGLAAADSVLAQQPSAFTPELLGALRKDAAGRASARGEIAGLDFEPFLGTQDPCERYEVGEATRTGRSVRVSIYGVCEGRRTAKPVAAAEVTPAGGSWQLANVHYPDGADLLKVLRAP